MSVEGWVEEGFVDMPDHKHDIETLSPVFPPRLRRCDRPGGDGDGQLRKRRDPAEAHEPGG